jgi:hypothetical protein
MKEPAKTPIIVHRIAASALAGWIERRKSFFYVRAYSRRWSGVYDLDRESGGAVSLQPLELQDHPIIGGGCFEHFITAEQRFSEHCS